MKNKTPGCLVRDDANQISRVFHFCGIYFAYLLQGRRITKSLHLAWTSE
jgi:hypothetical protein